ncbi:MAG: type III-B CRISPR module RAMP protein Cmr1 [Syntrophus sp. (in: bacteria)]
MEEVVFEIEAVTPMFLGGADIENGVPEFRAASIKGLLRYWYRAIYPKSLPTDEVRIFGSTDGRSPFRLKTELIEPKFGEKGDSWEGTSIAYLGYGLLKIREKKTWTQRKYFHTGSKFRISFRFDTSFPQNDKIFVLRAFWALSMLGGLGSRSRRGFGSYKIISNPLSSPELPPVTFSDQHAFTKALKEFVKLIKTDNYNESFEF